MLYLYLKGFYHPSERDSQHIAEIERELKKLECINSFVILFDSQQPRLGESLRAMLQTFTQIFGAERFYDNVILGFTRLEHTASLLSKQPGMIIIKGTQGFGMD